LIAKLDNIFLANYPQQALFLVLQLLFLSLSGLQPILQEFLSEQQPLASHDPGVVLYSSFINISFNHAVSITLQEKITFSSITSHGVDIISYVMMSSMFSTFIISACIHN
jgi:hypothetical protein